MKLSRPLAITLFLVTLAAAGGWVMRTGKHPQTPAGRSASDSATTMAAEVEALAPVRSGPRKGKSQAAAMAEHGTSPQRFLEFLQGYQNLDFPEDPAERDQLLRKEMTRILEEGGNYQIQIGEALAMRYFRAAVVSATSMEDLERLRQHYAEILHSMAGRMANPGLEDGLSAQSGQCMAYALAEQAKSGRTPPEMIASLAAAAADADDPARAQAAEQFFKKAEGTLLGRDGCPPNQKALDRITSLPLRAGVEQVYLTTAFDRAPATIPSESAIVGWYLGGGSTLPEMDAEILYLKRVITRHPDEAIATVEAAPQSLKKDRALSALIAFAGKDHMDQAGQWLERIEDAEVKKEAAEILDVLRHPPPPGQALESLVPARSHPDGDGK